MPGRTPEPNADEGPHESGSSGSRREGPGSPRLNRAAGVEANDALFDPWGRPGTRMVMCRRQLRLLRRLRVTNRGQRLLEDTIRREDSVDGEDGVEYSSWRDL